MTKKGLPTNVRMRADTHFVDHITSGRSTNVGRMVEIDRIEPNPMQPRREMRDIEELVSSIKERGILEPILVRPLETGMFQIIAGERRFVAAKQVGLSMVPCIELEVDDRGCLEISLVENLQRSDLTAFEEAEAIQRLIGEFQYTHEQIARKLGRSRPSVTEILSLNRMPARVRDACRRADITTKSTLLEIVRQPDEDSMLALVAAVSSEQLTRDEVRERKKASDPVTGAVPRFRPFVFKYKPQDRDFTLSLKFERETVDPRELVSALENIVAELREEIRHNNLAAFEPKAATHEGTGTEPEH